MLLDLILCGWGDAARAVAVTSKNHPDFIPWILLSAIGAGVLAGIAFVIGYMFGEDGKEKENGKNAGGSTFIVAMVISIIVYFAQ